MKNLHLIPTDKPSRLVKLKLFGKDKYNLSKEILPIQDEEQYQNIYITSNEEIKEGDWCYQVELNDGKVDKCYDVTLYHTWTNNGVDKTRKFKKIILTTDQNLIKDGVQAIDNEFLEWFVKNPSCEEVEVNEFPITNDPKGYKSFYKIIIPKEEQTKCYCGHTTYCDCGPEEPKQETLEEAAETFVKNRFTKQICGDEFYPDIYASKSSVVESHILFAKWQQEQHDLLPGFIKQFDPKEGEIKGWTAVQFLKWLELNKFKIIKYETISSRMATR